MAAARRRRPKKKPSVGGAREGSGRKAILKNPVKKLMRLEPRHVRVLSRYAKSNELSGDNAALRHILDTYDFTT